MMERLQSLSAEQKRTIVQQVAGTGEKSGGSAATTGSDEPGSAVAVGTVLPLAANLRDMPPSLTGRMPELAGLIVPDFDSFWWSEPAARVAGREVFGF
ncbi:hypothetical protein B4Q13_16960 [Lacticaseibacillus rhamnosus]